MKIAIVGTGYVGLVVVLVSLKWGRKYIVWMWMHRKLLI